jgi:hypothetical protein
MKKKKKRRRRRKRCKAEGPVWWLIGKAGEECSFAFACSVAESPLLAA